MPRVEEARQVRGHAVGGQVLWGVPAPVQMSVAGGATEASLGPVKAGGATARAGVVVPTAAEERPVPLPATQTPQPVVAVVWGPVLIVRDKPGADVHVRPRHGDGVVREPPAGPVRRVPLADGRRREGPVKGRQAVTAVALPQHGPEPGPKQVAVVPAGLEPLQPRPYEVGDGRGAAAAATAEPDAGRDEAGRGVPGVSPVLRTVAANPAISGP